MRARQLLRWIALACCAIGTGAVLYYLLDGAGYYLTPYSERPHHDMYRTLRPAGMRGQGFGVVGTAMILALFLYSLRKRSSHLSHAGPRSAWLSVHIFFGIVGPLLITLHTSFKVTGLVAVSYWSMIAVAVSGVVGRFLYRQIPRSVLGAELTKNDIRFDIDTFDSTLRREYGFDATAFQRLEALAGAGVGARSNAATDLWTLFRRNTRTRKQVAEFLRHQSRGREPQLTKLVTARVLLRRRLEFLTLVRSVFHYWHVIHKPFAAVMVVIMAVHIGIAVALGYTWIF